jgi:hypothetical protein
MKITQAQMLVMEAIAGTRKSGLGRTQVSLVRLGAELAGWKGKAEGEGGQRISRAVKEVRAAHKADIEEVKHKRGEAEAALMRAHEADGGALHPESIPGSIEKSMSVRIAHGNVPVFAIRVTPKSYENREAGRPWKAFSAAALVTFVAESLRSGPAMQSPDTAHDIACAVLVGAGAFGITKIISAVANISRFTPNEFYQRLAKASGAVQTALEAIGRELGIETAPDTESDSKK